MAKHPNPSPPPAEAPAPRAEQNLETPGDDSQPQPRKVPGRSRRYRILGKGEGDYCIYAITGPDEKLPQGTLVPIPEVPRFTSTAEAKRWIRNESGDRLSGKQVMIFRAHSIMSIQVQARPSVEITEKPPIPVEKAETSDE